METENNPSARPALALQDAERRCHCLRLGPSRLNPFARWAEFLMGPRRAAVGAIDCCVLAPRLAAVALPFHLKPALMELLLRARLTAVVALER